MRNTTAYDVVKGRLVYIIRHLKINTYTLIIATRMPKRKRSNFSDYKQKHNTAYKRNKRETETDALREVRLENLRTHATTSRQLETVEHRTTRLELLRKHSTVFNTKKWQNLINAAFSYEASTDYKNHPCLLIGSMTVVCSHCSATKFKGETSGLCCKNGKVQLPTLQTPPEPLKHLLLGDTPESRHFLDNIRKYNSCFQMTSFGTTKEVREPGYMPTFKIQGQVYHTVGSLLPLPDEQPKFLQIYFMGNDAEETQHRYSIIPGVRYDIVQELQAMLHLHNSYVHSFKSALERMPESGEDYKVIIKADKTPVGEHERRFNAPVMSEVAILIVGQEFEKRDIILEKQNSSLLRIRETHRAYDSLQYPLIFWEGQDGYNLQIPQTTQLTTHCSTSWLERKPSSNQ